MVDLTHKEWLEKDGGVEGPTHDETLAQTCQKRRIKWLIDHSVGDVLEVGCNYGYIVAEVAKKTGGQCVGFDINRNNILIANLKYPHVDFFDVDVTEPWADREFDTVMFPDVLEHIPEDKLDFVLSSAAKVTKDRLMITLPWEEKKRRCFKHKWLVNDTMLEVIMIHLVSYFDCVVRDCDGDFIYILATGRK